MYDINFQKHLSQKLEIEYEIIQELFENYSNDIFKVALTLIEREGVNQNTIGKIWGDYLGFAYVNPNASIINKEYVEKLGIDFIKANNAIPLYKLGRAVTVTTSNPTNIYIQDKLEKKLGEIVSLVFCFPFDIEEYIEKNK